MPEREPEEARFPSPYPARFAETRRALAAADWVWRDKRTFPKNNQELFASQFVLGQNLTDPAGEHQRVGTPSIDRDELSATLTDRSVAQSVPQPEIFERRSPFQARLRGWLLGG